MSALYFKGEWSSRFRKEDTKPRDFTLDDGSAVQVETMSGTAEGGAWREKDYVVGRLPYGDGSVAMYLPVPGQPHDRPTNRLRLGDLLSRLDWATLERSIDSIRPDHTTVQLPKFTQECNVSLKPALKSLSVRRAFSDREADLSAMGADPLGPLYLSDVRQRSVVEVNEEGTVAATIDIIPTFTTGVHVNWLMVDRPFVWLIRDERSKAVLFAGPCTIREVRVPGAETVSAPASGRLRQPPFLRRFL
jgi:serpin B